MARPFSLLLACCFLRAASRVLHVDPAGTDAGDCVSSACLSLGYALTQAASGEHIRLGAGVHRDSGNRDLNPGAMGKADLTIQGAGRDLTFLDFAGLGSGLRLNAAAGATVLEDFTMANGSCAHLPVGERHGGGLALVGSSAVVRRLAFRSMRCESPQTVFGGDFSGGAIFLKDSTAVLEDLSATDCRANHGAAVAMWGADRSTVSSSNFLRHVGTKWGGTLLAEGSSRTEFHNCYFAHGESPYGGHLDDGATASPLFKGCTFEYGVASAHGGHYYAYAYTSTRFESCELRHGYAGASAGGAYINGDTLPTFHNVTFFNNTAVTESGAVRSYYMSATVPLVFNRTRFIRNRVSQGTLTGGVFLTSTATLVDCVFEDNDAGAGVGGGLVVDGVSGLPLVMQRVSFVRNRATDGAGIWVMPGAQAFEMRLEDVTFEGNQARGVGGGIHMTGIGNLYLSSVTFRGNSAGGNGGALNIEKSKSEALFIQINDTVFEGNTAAGTGGAIRCIDRSTVGTHLDLRRVQVRGSRTFGNGAAMQTDCMNLRMRDSTMADNRALEGNGGAIEFGPGVVCPKDGPPIFEDVALFGNSAQQSGGALFFNHQKPRCAVPHAAGDVSTWAGSSSGPWRWSDFAGMVSSNVAAYGPLQATSPERLSPTCRPQVQVGNATDRCAVVGGSSGAPGVKIDGYSGMGLSVSAQLVDGFGQPTADPTLMVELIVPEDQRGPWSLHGITRHRFEGDEALVADVMLLQAASVGSAPYAGPQQAGLLLRLPRALVALKHVPPIALNVSLGSADGPCPPGHLLARHQTAAGMEACEPCPAGSFTADGGCRSCPVGRFTQQPASTGCGRCPTGHGCPAGTSVPAPCAPGSYQPDEGQESCLRCGVGEFQVAEGKSTCDACPAGTVTKLEGALSASDCVCAAGTWRSPETTQCRSCTKGMYCPAGSAAPQQVEGYFVRREAPAGGAGTYAAYHCLPSHCPAGPQGSCSAGRTGLACDRCEDFHYPCGEGACCSCQGVDLLPFLVGVAVMLLLAACFMRFSKVTMDIPKQRLTTITVLITAGQMVFMVQALSLLGSLELPWSEPLMSVLPALSILRFELETLRLPCMYTTGGQLLPYAVSLACFPALALCVLSVCAAKGVLGRARRFKDDVVNSLGALATACYLPAAIISLAPFICASNPSGRSSVRSMPSVICGEGEHPAMAAIGVFGVLLFVVLILGGVARVCMIYPRLMATSDGIRLMRRFRFLFQRFKPECHYYAFFNLLRSLCLALVPVILPSLPTVQIVALGTIIVAWTAFQCWLQPWRTWSANALDAAIGVLLSAVLIAGAGTIDTDVDRAKRELALLCTAALAAALGALLGVCCYAIYRHLFAGRSKHYAAFLSHHKAGAACLARFLKTCITKATRRPVFLDSDDLTNLDTLFETMRTDVANVIVILTEQTLRRVWCAGELVMAFKHEVPMYPLNVGGYKGFSEEGLACVDELWTSQDVHQLTAAGITPEDVREAYEHLAARQPVELPSQSRDPADLEMAARTLMFHAGLQSRAWSQKAARSDGLDSGSLVMLTDLDGTESLAAAGVLQGLLASQAQLETRIIFDGSGVRATNAGNDTPKVLVLLGRRCLSSSNFAGALLACKEAWPDGRFVSVVIDPNYQFPSKQQVDNEIAPALADQLGVPVEDMQQCYQDLLKILALPLSLHLSTNTLNMETVSIVRRLRSAERRTSKAGAPRMGRESSLVAARSSSTSVSQRASETPREAPANSATEGQTEATDGQKSTAEEAEEEKADQPTEQETPPVANGWPEADTGRVVGRASL